MQKLEIHPLPPSHPNDWGLRQEIGYWLGRMWSLCTFPFELLNRITQVAVSYLFGASKQQTSQDPSYSPALSNDSPLSQKLSAKKFKSEEPQKTLIEDSNLDLDAFFYSDSEELPNQTDLTNDAQKINLGSEQEIKPNSAKDIDKIPAKIDRLSKRRQQRKDDLLKAQAQVSLRPAQTSDPSQPALKSAKNSQKLSPAQVANKPDKLNSPIIMEVGGGGNCQLLSILKGLEKQYPAKIKQYQEKYKKPLNVQALRKMGVDFAREQIDKCGAYAEEVLGYLRSDRDEFNKDMERRKKSIRSQTDADFLNRLEKNGFYCSTLHLYALNIKLGLHIHVHQEKGIKGHDIQYFDFIDSKDEPIHLFRMQKFQHYKYMYFPEKT